MFLATQINSALVNGLVPLAFGIYSSLIGYGIIPAHPSNPKKSSQWRARWGTQARIGGPILILVGLFLTVRALL